jgi:hypothetical protein
VQQQLNIDTQELFLILCSFPNINFGILYLALSLPEYSSYRR